MTYCTSNLHGDGSRSFEARGRGQPPAFCPACTNMVARRNADWQPWQWRCVVCDAPRRGRRMHSRTCSPTCRSQLHRVLKRIHA
ncbi:MAG: hypothetical protein OXN16_07155 [Gammaproteobacteria bacterium]|nr:hypothetical protein [Gammaproteobacteria bacterium]